MLILLLQIMFIISILSFGVFFFFGKVRMNGIITNKITHALYGALWFMLITDLVLFVPVGMIIVLVNII